MKARLRSVYPDLLVDLPLIKQYGADQDDTTSMYSGIANGAPSQASFSTHTNGHAHSDLAMGLQHMSLSGQTAALMDTDGRELDEVLDEAREQQPLGYGVEHACR